MQRQLTPILRDLNQTAKVIADRLLELKQQDDPKGWVKRISDLLGVVLGAIFKLLTILTILVLIVGIVLHHLWSRGNVILEEFKAPPELEQKGNACTYIFSE